MEHYPDIQRRNGTLFFACPETDRAAIATSIERLIDMLDAMADDPDLEPDGDELDQSFPEGGGRGLQHYLEDDEDGADLEDDQADKEPSLGWTNKIDQSTPIQHSATWFSGAEEEEPLLGWTLEGHFGDLEAANAERELDDSDREPNGDEADSSFDAEDCRWMGEGYDGSGVLIAEEMIRGLPIAAGRSTAYAAVSVPVVYHFSPGFRP